jgi:PAS domain S-box-containing protein
MASQVAPVQASALNEGAQPHLADLVTLERPVTPSGVKASILIVDDRPDKLLALESILSDLGQNVVCVRSGKEALRRLLKQNFAVILLDVSMPEMDGFETASLIRKRIDSEHTPIIFITSIGNTENQIARGYAAGAVDYILTPIVPEVLRTKVSVFVELHKQSELIKLQAAQIRQAEQARHERQLAEFSGRLLSETKRNRFFTLAVDMLALADSEGRFLQTNPSWEAVLGYSAAELSALNTRDLAHPEDREAFARNLDKLKTKTVPVEFEARCCHKDGSCRWLYWTAAPFISEDLVYFFARDVTRRKEAEAQVSRLNHELERRVAALTEANRELEAFNYSIAHDLRAPLRSMSGFARALVEDESQSLTEIGQEYARRIHRSARFMDALLLDLLTYSRLARGELILSPVDLDEVVRELVAVMDKEIVEIKASIEIASPLGLVHAHLPTLKQIIGNLISNSVKFVVPERTPRIRIYSTPGPGTLRLWVEDNGIGIAPEHHDKIFWLFHRLQDAQKYPGTGIGLALVRKGAERMGGRAGVISKRGEGSRFWVEFAATET